MSKMTAGNSNDDMDTISDFAMNADRVMGEAMDKMLDGKISPRDYIKVVKKSNQILADIEREKYYRKALSSECETNTEGTQEGEKVESRKVTGLETDQNFVPLHETYRVISVGEQEGGYYHVLAMSNNTGRIHNLHYPADTDFAIVAPKEVHAAGCSCDEDGFGSP